MGIFSFIGGAISSIGAGIAKVASCISTAVTKVATNAFKAATTALSTLAAGGGFIGTIAAGAGKILAAASAFMAGPLGPIVGPIIARLVVEAIGKAIGWVAKKLGIIKEDEEPEEVGYRMEEAAKHDDWEKREAFGSFTEYHDYLREKIPASAIDRKKLEQNRLMYMSLGINALKGGIETKLGLDMPIDFLIEIGKCRLDGQELNALLEEFSVKGYDLSLFRQYLQGDLSSDMRRKIEDGILIALKNVYPEKSDTDLREKISAMRDVSREDGNILKNYATELDQLIDKKKEEQTEQDMPKLINDSKGATEK